MAFNKLLVEYLSLLSCSGKKGIWFYKSVVTITLEYNDSLSCLCLGEGVCERDVGACVFCEVLGVGPSIIIPSIMSEPV